MTKVAIITVDYNNHSDTQELLTSAQKLDIKGLDTLWLVVDNGSDVSVRETVEKFPKTVWIQAGNNLGFAGGFNLGMKYAMQWGADYLLLINNDTLFGDKTILKNLINILTSNPNSGIVSPKILFAPGFEYHKDKYTKKDVGKVIWYAGGSYDWANVASKHRGIDTIDSGEFDQVEQTDFVSGCCVMIKKEILEKVGFLEEKLFAYYEDADWVQRIKQQGYMQWYCGTSYIYHKVSRTSGIGSDFTDYFTSRNRLWLGFKYAPLRTKIALARESLRLLLSGRSAQKDGIRDYFISSWNNRLVKRSHNVDYPLELSIIIVNYQSKDLTLKLLGSLYANTDSYLLKKTEVIVIDNSPQEKTVPEINSKYPQIKTIINSHNTGFSYPNNQGINYSRGKYVLLLNSDVEIKPNSISSLLAPISQYGDRGIYVGKLEFSDGSFQDSCFWLPTPWRAFEEYFLKRQGKYFMYRPNTNKITRVEGAVMAVYLLPKLVLNELGLLQEDTFIYFEDVEYARRAKVANVPIYYVPQSEFIHHHGQSSKAIGITESNSRLIKASKWYHGIMVYYLLTAILWAGQKFGKVTTPQSRWKQPPSTP